MQTHQAPCGSLSVARSAPFYTTIVLFLVLKICIKCGLFHRKLHVQGKFLLNTRNVPALPLVPCTGDSGTWGSLQNLPEAVAGVPRVEGLSCPRVALSPPDSSVLQGKRTSSVLLGFGFLTPTFVSSSPQGSVKQPLFACFSFKIVPVALY